GRVPAEWKFANWAQLRDGAFATNGALGAWARQASSRLESHVGAARFDFATRPPVRDGRWYAGDAVQLIPPFVGDGMAMALEGGELAGEGLLAGWSDARYGGEWRRRFGARIRVARALHPLLWAERLHEPSIALLSRLPGFAGWVYARTRGAAAMPRGGSCQAPSG
ncbi:MAG: hypothetical protein HY075_14735, partial [Deltaproteobacteria bacterium]|nr:hypothetical protein [Deltaproteobacteria bacterium]